MTGSSGDLERPDLGDWQTQKNIRRRENSQSWTLNLEQHRAKPGPDPIKVFQRKSMLDFATPKIL